VEHEAFFSTAAQVIPVLAVLAVLDNRLFKRTRMRELTYGALCLFATAEFVAFCVLWGWSPELQGLAGAIVGGTMALGALFLLLGHDDSVLPQGNARGPYRRLACNRCNDLPDWLSA